MKAALVLQLFLGSLLFLGVALGEPPATEFHHSNDLTSSSEVSSDWRPGERRLTTSEVWCIAMSNVSDAALQSSLDWACGPLQGQGQTDCSSISAGGVCFDPDTTFHHASFAFNEYFQYHNATLSACDFSGTATVTNLDPSQGTCIFTGTFTSGNSNTTIIIGAPANSPAYAPVPAGVPPPQSGSETGFKRSYLRCMAIGVTAITYLFI